MQFLKITQADQSSVLVDIGNVIHIGLTAPVTGNHNRAGRITEVRYQSQTTTLTAAVIVIVAGIAQYNGANVLYEIGCLDPSGVFNAHASNR